MMTMSTTTITPTNTGKAIDGSISPLPLWLKTALCYAFATGPAIQPCTGLLSQSHLALRGATQGGYHGY